MKFDISHEGRTTLSTTRVDAEALGYPEQVIADAEGGVRKEAAKAECRRRIYSAASAETQMNMATAAAVISAKEASARTEDEASILSGLDDAIGWVAQMRVRVTELADDATLDIGDDANWPPLPDGARGVVDKF
ncbi:hypothetical protein [Sulfitobacter pontiacus]|uniref:hypothetical protein n=1 Tax=Sulfitobacter pontiacus TaxID=60137 RepID=UPI0010432C8A|nr:hypothetical protein [Sulfitobacter pontiacus]